MERQYQDMDCSSYVTTPNRSDSCKLNISRKKGFDRSSTHPYKCSAVELNSTVLAPGSIIETMPLYTPPKPLQHIKNPFEHGWLLKEKLSQLTCSPSLFQKVISPINKSSTFSWSVDEISDLRPAPIDENPSQEFASWFSPDTESQAQAAIDRFFSSMSGDTLQSPVVNKEEPKTKSVECQTSITYMPTLPPCLQAELNAVHEKIAAWQEDPNFLNSSTCSARRKLLATDSPLSNIDSSASLSDQEELSVPMFAATPVKRLPHSSPECSPIRPNNQSVMDVSLNCLSSSVTEESGFQSQNSVR